MLFAINNAVAARGKRPAVLFSIGWMSAYMFTAGFAILMTSVHEQLHHSTVYLWLTITMFVLFPFFLFLPKTTDKTQSIKIPKGTLLTGLMLMLSVALVVSAMMAYYAFLERISMNINGNTAHAGIIVAISQLGGMLGGGLAIPISIRYGIIRPLLIAIAIHAVIVAIACSTDSIYVLAAVAFAEGIVFIIYTPLVYALVAEVDRQGRWAAIAGGVFVLSTAMGPLFGGYLAETSGYSSVSIINIAVAVPAIILCVWVGRRVIK
jgi:MFS family permease